MKHSLSASILTALIAVPLCAQDEQPEPAKPAKPRASAPEAQDKQGQPPQAQEKDVKAWIEQLGDASYQVRKKAEDSLRGLGKSALPLLESAAEKSGDEEIRWRARRLARQIETGDQGALKRRVAQPRGGNFDLTPGDPGIVGGDLDQWFNQMFERMEREGIDVPRQRFFHNDFFRDLDKQMQELRKGGVDLYQQGQSMQMRIGPDGVKVEVQEKGADGKSETKTYEAPDMDSFREKYPEIAQRYLGRGRAFAFRNFGLQDFNDPNAAFPGQLRFSPAPSAPETDVPPEGERLGVFIEPIGDELREYLGIDQGVGLKVKSVNDGSLAERLGMHEGDVLLSVQGRDVRGVEDVRAALRGVDAGAKVEVVVSRKGQRTTLDAKKPASAGAHDEKHDEKAEKPAKPLEKKKKAEIR